jgi:threonine/homoserine/homoserine lactone efflux protein
MVMALRTWLLFCATDVALCVTSGPAVLLVVSQAISKGTWSGVAGAFLVAAGAGLALIA